MGPRKAKNSPPKSDPHPILAHSGGLGGPFPGRRILPLDPDTGILEHLEAAVTTAGSNDPIADHKFDWSLPQRTARDDAGVIALEWRCLDEGSIQCLEVLGWISLEGDGALATAEANQSIAEHEIDCVFTQWPPSHDASFERVHALLTLDDPIVYPLVVAIRVFLNAPEAARATNRHVTITDPLRCRLVHALDALAR